MQDYGINKPKSLFVLFCFCTWLRCFPTPRTIPHVNLILTLTLRVILFLQIEAQSHKTVLPSGASYKFQELLVLLTNCLYLTGFPDPLLLKFINFTKMAHRHGETIYLPLSGKVWDGREGSMQTFHALCGGLILPALWCVCQLRNSLNFIVQEFL